MAFYQEQSLFFSMATKVVLFLLWPDNTTVTLATKEETSRGVAMRVFLVSLMWDYFTGHYSSSSSCFGEFES